MSKKSLISAVIFAIIGIFIFFVIFKQSDFSNQSKSGNILNALKESLESNESLEDNDTLEDNSSIDSQVEHLEEVEISNIEHNPPGSIDVPNNNIELI